MNKIKQIMQGIQKGIMFLFVKLGIVRVKETKVSCKIEEVESGVYGIEINM